MPAQLGSKAAERFISRSSHPSLIRFEEQALAGRSATFTRTALNAGVALFLFDLTGHIGATIKFSTLSPLGLLRGTLGTLHFAVRLGDSVEAAKKLIEKKSVEHFSSLGLLIRKTIKVGLEMAFVTLLSAVIIGVIFAALRIPAPQPDSAPVEYSLTLFLSELLPTFIAADREEIIMRRLIFGSLLKKMKPWHANLIQAGIFVLPHYFGYLSGGKEAGFVSHHWSSALNLFVSGLIFGHAYRKGGYWSGVIAHFLFNITVSAGNVPSSPGAVPLVFILFGFIVLTGGISLLADGSKRFLVRLLRLSA